MKVDYHKKFLKELAGLPREMREVIEYFAFQSIKDISSISEIKNLTKLRGYDDLYRIRFGDYRLGIRLDGERLILERIIHRSHSYRKFP